MTDEITNPLYGWSEEVVNALVHYKPAPEDETAGKIIREKDDPVYGAKGLTYRRPWASGLHRERFSELAGKHSRWKQVSTPHALLVAGGRGRRGDLFGFSSGGLARLFQG